MSKNYIPAGGISVQGLNTVAWEEQDDNYKAQRLEVRAWRKLKSEMRHN